MIGSGEPHEYDWLWGAARTMVGSGEPHEYDWLWGATRV
jgi:hypothetical protein